MSRGMGWGEIEGIGVYVPACMYAISNNHVLAMLAIADFA